MAYKYSLNLVGEQIDFIFNNETILAQKLNVLHPLKTFWPLLILELIRSTSMAQSTR